jgi:thiamine biosynthesis lipoprotein
MRLKVIMIGSCLSWTLPLILATVLGGCGTIQTSGSPVVVKRTQMHMGTLVSITVMASDEATAHAAATAGFREIKRLEQLLSTWIATSELSRVNQAAGKQAVVVGHETLELVRRSLEMARLTEGGFNIALGPAIEAWSVTERQRIPGPAELQALKPLVDWASIQVRENESSIFLPREGMRIDVGGIGKGYAADRAAEELKKAGALGGVVALAGDIKTFGNLPDRSGFPVGIRHPRQDGALVGIIDLQDEAISTAGDYERYFEQDGVRYHHILDPVSLEPAPKCQSVTIVAKEGIVADGLDTGIFVMGPERGMELVERLPDVEAVIIDGQGRMTVSSGLRERLRNP